MAYFGKEFKFEKEENYENFNNAVAAVEEKFRLFLTYKPNFSLQKNGDEYIVVIIDKEKGFKKEVVFKPGVPFEENIGNVIKIKSVINVDGDTFTQVQDFGKGTITLKREFSADRIKLTITSSVWDGVAYRYFVPA